MARHTLDVASLFAALDRHRKAHGQNWKDVAGVVGVSQSTFTRLSDGHRPDADALCSLVVWLGVSLRQFVKAERFGAGDDP